MRIKRTFLSPLAIAFAVLLLSPAIVFSQTRSGEPQTVTLLARRKVDGVDNYTQAAFSFKYGVNGDAALRITRNNWDLLFGNSPLADAFDVTMVTDDCSRIKDLGALDWSDPLQVPALPAYPEPTREPSVKAIAGHMYVVHTKDRDNDHYALFRVEALEPDTSVTISWKLIQAPNDIPGVIAAVVSAVAPATYPAIARQANARGETIIEVQVDAEGNVLSTKLISGHPLLETVSREAAKQWKFSALQGSTKERAVRLTFGYQTVDKGPKPKHEFTTVFLPPYKVEMQAHPRLSH